MMRSVLRLKPLPLRPSAAPNTKSIGTKRGVIAVACATVCAGGVTCLAVRSRTPAVSPQPSCRELAPTDPFAVLVGESPSALQLIARVLSLAWIFAPLVVLYVFFGRHERHHAWWLRRAVRAVERAGPAFVKAGQWACTRHDLTSPAFRAAFGKLFSGVAPHSMEETKRAIETEFQAPLDTVFSELDAEAVGSGSIGQVHRAVLRDGQREVAVKVLHPGVRDGIARDFLLLQKAAAALDFLFPAAFRHLELPVQARVWGVYLASQLDLRVEGQNLRALCDNFAQTDYVQVPQPVRSTPSVLVQSFCEGQPATPEYLATLPEATRDIIAGKGINCYCKMLLRDNLVHGDLHPGNILVDARDPAAPVVSLLDVGLCLDLTPQEAANSRRLVASFCSWDAQECVAAVLGMGSHQRFADIPAFERSMHELFRQFKPEHPHAPGGGMENVLNGMFECARAARVTMDPKNANLTFSVLVLEGFVNSLNRDFDMVTHAASWLLPPAPTPSSVADTAASFVATAAPIMASALAVAAVMKAAVPRTTIAAA